MHVNICSSVATVLHEFVANLNMRRLIFNKNEYYFTIRIIVHHTIVNNNTKNKSDGRVDLHVLIWNKLRITYKSTKFHLGLLYFVYLFQLGDICTYHSICFGNGMHSANNAILDKTAKDSIYWRWFLLRNPSNVHHRLPTDLQPVVSLVNHVYVLSSAPVSSR